jgi:organic radical activating enzyme
MLYRIESGKIRTHAVEFAAADHCNLRCSGCSHMSPFTKPRLAAEDELLRDMGRLATAMFADEIRILGGEPLLNPRIIPILQAARASGIAARVVLTTNGLLLHKMPGEFWRNVDRVNLSLYPGARPTDEHIQQSHKIAEQSGTEILVSEYSSFRTTVVTEPHRADAITAMIFRTCKNAHLYHCHMVHAGWLYKCACPSVLREFSENIGHSAYDPNHDGFDIHVATDLRNQLWDFLTDSKPLDACRYCLGYVGYEQPHHQLSVAETREARSQRITRKSHLSKATFARESLKYFGRRIAETVTRKPRW